MYQVGDIQQFGKGKSFLKQTLGTDNLAATSPVNLAGRIKVPVLLAAGGQDKRAPLGQTEAMERALKRSGVPVQTLIYSDEQHGFYDPKHVAEFDRQLLEFLDKNIGGGAKSGGAP